MADIDPDSGLPGEIDHLLHGRNQAVAFSSDMDGQELIMLCRLPAESIPLFSCIKTFRHIHDSRRDCLGSLFKGFPKQPAGSIQLFLGKTALSESLYRNPYRAGSHHCPHMQRQLLRMQCVQVRGKIRKASVRRRLSEAGFQKTVHCRS